MPTDLAIAWLALNGWVCRSKFQVAMFGKSDIVSEFSEELESSRKPLESTNKKCFEWIKQSEKYYGRALRNAYVVYTRFLNQIHITNHRIRKKKNRKFL